MNTFQNNFKKFYTSTVAKKKKKQQKTLSAIITFEQSYFNCGVQIATRDEGSRKRNRPPPFRRSSSKYSAVHNSGATLQNCPFCKFQVEFMICALIVYGQVMYFCKGFATRILLKKNFFLK